VTGVTLPVSARVCCQHFDPHPKKLNAGFPLIVRADVPAKYAPSPKRKRAAAASADSVDGSNATGRAIDKESQAKIDELASTCDQLRQELMDCKKQFEEREKEVKELKAKCEQFEKAQEVIDLRPSPSPSSAAAPAVTTTTTPPTPPTAPATTTTPIVAMTVDLTSSSEEGRPSKRRKL